MNDFKPPCFIHPLSDVEPGCTIGRNTKIWRWTHVREGAVIGDNTMVGACCFIDTTVRIGGNCRIQNNCFIPNGVILGDQVFLGPSVTFCNVKKPKAGKRGKFEQTLVKDGAVIGAGAVVLPGITIGENAVIGAGSVVTKDVPSNEMAWGCPARVQKYQWFRGHEEVED